MVSEILLLTGSFSWVRKMYQEVLSLTTTSELLRRGRGYYQLFDIPGVLNKLLFFWSEQFHKSDVSFCR